MKPIPINERAPEFPAGTVFLKARAYQTDETFGYDRWVADQYSCGRGVRDAIIVLLPDQPTTPTERPEESTKHECLQGQPGDTCTHEFCRPTISARTNEELYHAQDTSLFKPQAAPDDVPTPETDEAVHKFNAKHCHGGDYDLPANHYVSADFARSLERRLVEAREDQMQALGLCNDDHTVIANEIRRIRDEGRGYFHELTALRTHLRALLEGAPMPSPSESEPHHG